ncbi:MAG: 16S rRNA (guanine(966)-N(2))-methyltransferase RsmD [Holophagales bacterium]|nr:16S rRNA (guanine(966)-N(2))-methyltransferase RsmD [Holophagales bacterium]
MIRIVAGEFRGRRLAVGPGVRPTTERAREALFSILGEDVRGARVLDAAAGSGALGFEALSRGASEVVFVEANRRTATVIEANAATLGRTAEVRVFAGTVAGFLRLDRPGCFDVVFFDPPWADPVTGELDGLWKTLAPGGTFVVERGSAENPWPGSPVEAVVRRYGTTALHIFRNRAPDSAEADGSPDGIDPTVRCS